MRWENDTTYEILCLNDVAQGYYQRDGECGAKQPRCSDHPEEIQKVPYVPPSASGTTGGSETPEEDTPTGATGEEDTPTDATGEEDVPTGATGEEDTPTAATGEEDTPTGATGDSDAPELDVPTGTTGNSEDSDDETGDSESPNDWQHRPAKPKCDRPSLLAQRATEKSGKKILFNLPKIVV